MQQGVLSEAIDAQRKAQRIPAKNQFQARCPYCQKKGYRGRIGIYELMIVNGRLREKMFAGRSSADLRTEAINSGMTTLYCDGLRKVITGITTLDEVYRTAKKTEQEHIAIEKVIKEFMG